MNLLIDGKLTLPPSSVSCFRDVTLYSTIFANFDVLIETRNKHKDMIWHWLKQKGAADYVKDFVRPGQESGFSVSYKRNCNVCVTRITARNLSFIVSRLKQHARWIEQFDPFYGIDESDLV